MWDTNAGPSACGSGCTAGVGASGACGASAGSSTACGSTQGGYQAPDLSEIRQLPHHGVAIFRDSAANVEVFCAKLKEELQRYQFGTVRFDNIDVSNVVWTQAHLSQLFTILRLAGATSQRIKAFRCGAKDPAVLSLCEWLACTESSKLPQEYHLSHNELTTGSLEALITVLEVKSLRHRPSFPYWIRIEGNKMLPSFINDLAKDGRACLAMGKCSTRSCEFMQPGQKPSLFHLRFGANQQPAPQTSVVFPSVVSSLNGVAPEDGAAAAFPPREELSTLMGKIESAYAMMKALRAAQGEPNRALAENAAIVAQDELIQAADTAVNEAKAAWQVKTPIEGCPSQAEIRWQHIQASMQQQQQAQQQQQVQWQQQQWQQQQMQQQQMQQQQMQQQQMMQMQWQAEQQQLQAQQYQAQQLHAQQLQAQQLHAQWQQRLQQAQQPQPEHTHQTKTPQTETLEASIVRLLEEHKKTSPQKPEVNGQPAPDDAEAQARALSQAEKKFLAAAAAKQIEERRIKEEQEKKKDEGSKESKASEKEEQIPKKAEVETVEVKEAKEEKEVKKPDAMKEPIEQKEKTPEKKTTATSSATTGAPRSPERKDDKKEKDETGDKEDKTSAGSAPPWRAHRRTARKPVSRSRTRPIRRRTRKSPSRSRRPSRKARKTRSPSGPSKESKPSKESTSVPAAPKKKPPGANSKSKPKPKAAPREELIVVEEDNAAEDAKEQELQEQRERGAERARVLSAVSNLFGGDL